MKNFPRHFDPIFGIAVVKLWFQIEVAVAVELGGRKAKNSKTFFLWSLKNFISVNEKIV